MLAALVFQVVTATPPTPTPSIVRGGQTRTLSDVARELKSRPKGPGTISITGSSEGAGNDAAAEAGSSRGSKGTSGKSRKPTGTADDDAILDLERVDSPGVSGSGTVPIEGTVSNRGDSAACSVRLQLRVFYENGALAAERVLTVKRVDAHGSAMFTGSVAAPQDLGMSAKQQPPGTSVLYGRAMKPMGRVEALIESHKPCR